VNIKIFSSSSEKLNSSKHARYYHKLSTSAFYVDSEPIHVISLKSYRQPPIKYVHLSHQYERAAAINARST